MAGGMAMGGMMDCNGGSIPDRQGNFQGHAFPGTIFIIWGLHVSSAALARCILFVFGVESCLFVCAVVYLCKLALPMLNTYRTRLPVPDL